MSKFYTLSNLSHSDYTSISQNLIDGELAVLPTDTIYGIHGLALSQPVVEKIYQLKQRNAQKGFIIAISSLEDLKLFRINLKPANLRFLTAIWPNPVSVILDCPRKDLNFLHHGSQTLAFRMPSHTFLQSILKQTGPLISTSANISGQKNAETIKKAETILGDMIDIYVDGGILNTRSSTVVKLQDDDLILIREGAVDFASLRQQFEALH